MNTRTYVCPRDDYPLVPVYSVEGRKRRIIALSCPEPYCDHMQLVPKDRARELERYYRHEQETSQEAVDGDAQALVSNDDSATGEARLVQ